MAEAFGWEIQVTSNRSKTGAKSETGINKPRGGVGHSSAQKEAEKEVLAKQDYLKWRLTRKKRKADWEESASEPDEQPPQILSPVERALWNAKSKPTAKSTKSPQAQPMSNDGPLNVEPPRAANQHPPAITQGGKEGSKKKKGKKTATGATQAAEPKSVSEDAEKRMRKKVSKLDEIRASKPSTKTKPRTK